MSASSLLMENICDLHTRREETYKRFNEGSKCPHGKFYNSQTRRFPKVHLDPPTPKRPTMASSPQWTHLQFPLASAGEVLAAGVVLPIVCLACVMLRFVARGSQKVRPGLDDWLLVPAAVSLPPPPTMQIKAYRRTSADIIPSHDSGNGNWNGHMLHLWLVTSAALPNVEIALLTSARLLGPRNGIPNTLPHERRSQEGTSEVQPRLRNRSQNRILLPALHDRSIRLHQSEHRPLLSSYFRLE